MTSLLSTSPTTIEIQNIMNEVRNEISSTREETQAPENVPVQSHIVYVLDKSGSMYNLKSDTIGSFESWCKSQETKIEGEDLPPRLSIVQFSDPHDIEFKHYDNIKDRDILVYEPEGCTALYDALGLVFDEYGTEENVIVLINTDGQDNTSIKWTKEKIKEKIEKFKEEKGWIFEFAAANQDAWAVGNSMGIDTSINYVPTPQGLRTLSQNQMNTSLNYRRNSVQRQRSTPVIGSVGRRVGTDLSTEHGMPPFSGLLGDHIVPRPRRTPPAIDLSGLDRTSSDWLGPV